MKTGTARTYRFFNGLHITIDETGSIPTLCTYGRGHAFAVSPVYTFNSFVEAFNVNLEGEDGDADPVALAYVSEHVIDPCWYGEDYRKFLADEMKRIRLENGLPEKIARG